MTDDDKFYVVMMIGMMIFILLFAGLLQLGKNNQRNKGIEFCNQYDMTYVSIKDDDYCSSETGQLISFQQIKILYE